ncbi:TATA-box-binding protein-like [Clytia hemisphaerica]|uniref:Uncharacterized protein n=1 Tax=Clytia hemisphaerica TaxID=252671 RepID=A0A7M5UMN9_9CNID|eukprot:TCONS_00000011-protein
MNFLKLVVTLLATIALINESEAMPPPPPPPSNQQQSQQQQEQTQQQQEQTQEQQQQTQQQSSDQQLVQPAQISQVTSEEAPECPMEQLPCTICSEGLKTKCGCKPGCGECTSIPGWNYSFCSNKVEGRPLD